MSDSVRGEVVSEAMRVGRELALRYVSGQASDVESIVNTSSVAFLDGITPDETLYLYGAAPRWRDKILDEMRVVFLAREALSALDVLNDDICELDRYVTTGEGSLAPNAFRDDITALSVALNPLLDNPTVYRADEALSFGFVPSAMAFDALRDELRAIIERGTATEPEEKSA